MNENQICIREPGRKYRLLGEDEILLRALEIAERRFTRLSPALADPKAARDFLRLRIGRLDHEVFSCTFVDNRHRVIAFEEMFRGTLDGASVHPREVLKAALHHNAAGVIFAHNHPSGVAEPSDADRRLTQRLKDALALVDIRVLDHFVVSSTDVVSFAERGLL